jgi:enamine deaminase RidA (YjgF/YER057c/UK114 family)
MPEHSSRKLPAQNRHAVLQPVSWPQPQGYANGIKARGETIFVGGMVGYDTAGRFPQGFVAQARQALENIVAVLAQGGAGPEHVVRLTWYVLDMDEYVGCRKELGRAYRDVMGSNFPAMALVEVRRLFDPDARLEIEATAVVPE